MMAKRTVSEIQLMVVFCALRSITITTSVPILPEEIKNYEYDFEDNWNYEVAPHSIPLLDSSSSKFQPANYEYSEEIDVIELNSTQKQSSRQPKQLKFRDLVRSSVSCGVCQLGVAFLNAEIKKGSSVKDMKKLFVSLCTLYKIETEPVCSGFFDVFAPDLLPAYTASKLAPEEVCKLIFGEACEDKGKDVRDWEIPLSDNELREARTMELPVRPTSALKVLQLSDVHLDPDYAENTVANCEEPLCCRPYSTPLPTEPTILSGRWGAYPKCDSPSILVENMLKHIALQHPDIDYILWTGDLPPHDIWNQTRKSNLDIIKETHRQMKEFFPSTPIFPAIGNHESVPAGTFAPPWMSDDNHSIKWLYNVLADEWKTWLPASSGNTVLHGAFYSVLLKPGFRLISLNTNYCHNFNWWLLVNSTDPSQQLKWLIHELDNAEFHGEKVHIIGHIAPGSSDCYKVWSKNFYSIVDRYRHTIVGQFYGHTHADEVEVFYDSKNFEIPVSIAYIAPSVTTYENFNPAYRIYYVDGDYEGSTRAVLEHETWTTDLERANKGDNKPVWYRLYLAKDEYKMNSLKPEEWDKLIKRMHDDDELFELFHRNYYRDSPTRPVCDYKCKMQILCDLKSGKSHSRKQLCQEFV